MTVNGRPPLPFDTGHACWAPYRGLLDTLDFREFPTARQLNALLPVGACSGGGQPLRFIPAGELPGVAYERHIFETGQVSTREENWHDLFNALAWCRFPRLKAAMNAQHYKHLGEEMDGRRGPLRDALTLLDESGVIVTGSNREVLISLAERDWDDAFCAQEPAWKGDLRVRVCGHAVLEKLLEPYKALTAHAIFLEASESMDAGPLDAWLAEALIDGRLFDSTAGLSPLPVMGLPGWWTAGPQDGAFYADPDVFRRPPAGSRPAPVHRV